MNSFYRTIFETLKLHYPSSDHRCICGQQRDDWEWADQAPHNGLHGQKEGAEDAAS